MRKDNSGQGLDFDRVEAIHGFRTTLLRGQTKVPRYFSSCLIARLSYPGGFPWSRCGYKVKLQVRFFHPWNYEVRRYQIPYLLYFN